MDEKKQLNDEKLNDIKGGYYNLYNNKTGELLAQTGFKNETKKMIKKYLEQGVELKVMFSNLKLDDPDLSGIWHPEDINLLNKD